MILTGDNRETLKQIESNSVDCCVTSPPYFQLRDYEHEHQIGSEETPSQFIETMVGVFAQVHRVLTDRGTLFLNIGDSYASKKLDGIKQKDLIGIPWMLAFALRDFGWYLRQDIIWHKPAPMPSSVKDRCTSSHEYVFVFAKSPSYYWDWFAISEKSVSAGQSMKMADGWDTNSGGHGSFHREGREKGKQNGTIPDRRNKRSVWKINTESYKKAHFAVYPRELVQTCLLAGCPETVCVECGKPWERAVDIERVATRPGTDTKTTGDSAVDGNRDPERHVSMYIDNGVLPACECDGDVRKGKALDPFLGSGTTAEVAQRLGHNWVGCELNESYVKLIRDRVRQKSLL